MNRAGVVQHAGIDGLARVDLGDVAGRRIIEDRRGMRPDQVQLLQAERPSGRPSCGWPRDRATRPCRRSRRCPCRSSPRASSPVPGAGRPGRKYANSMPCHSPQGFVVHSLFRCRARGGREPSSKALEPADDRIAVAGQPLVIDQGRMQIAQHAVHATRPLRNGRELPHADQVTANAEHNRRCCAAGATSPAARRAGALRRRHSAASRWRGPGPTWGSSRARCRAAD